MKMKLFFLTLLFSLTLTMQSQEIYETISNKVCECIEKERTMVFDDIKPCFESVMFDHMNQLLDYHQAKSLDEINGTEVGERVLAKLIKNCNYVGEMMAQHLEQTQESVEKDTSLTCSELQKGEYYYLQTDDEGQLTDTTFVTFTDDLYLERMLGGRTYSLLRLEWLSDCKFKLTFVDSNDPYKSSYSMKGESYEYEIVQSDRQKMTVRGLQGKNVVYIQYFKIKNVLD